MDLKPGGDAMQLTFPCPKCGKEYDLPWSMAGKKARCKRCSGEFVVPAPFEPTSPRSSEAIPVSGAADGPSATPGPRPIRAQDPPPTELIEGLRTGRVARTTKIEALRQPPTDLSRNQEPAFETDPSGFSTARSSRAPTQRGRACARTLAPGRRSRSRCRRHGPPG